MLMQVTERLLDQVWVSGISVVKATLKGKSPGPLVQTLKQREDELRNGFRGEDVYKGLTVFRADAERIVMLIGMKSNEVAASWSCSNTVHQCKLLTPMDALSTSLCFLVLFFFIRFIVLSCTVIR